MAIFIFAYASKDILTHWNFNIDLTLNVKHNYIQGPMLSSCVLGFIQNETRNIDSLSGDNEFCGEHLSREWEERVQEVRGVSEIATGHIWGGCFKTVMFTQKHQAAEES